MKFSIIIPYYNGQKYLEKCLESIERCTLYHDYEIIIVDDASPKIISKVIKKRFSRAKYFRNKRNNGFVKTVMRGAKEASGEVFIFLNMDTEIISSGWLYTLKETFSSNQKNGIVGGKLLFPDSGLIQFAGGIINPRENRPEHLYYKAPYYFPAVNKMRTVDYITGAFFSIPRNLFWSMGGFSREYHSANEDVDLSLRVKQRGYRIIYNPNIILYHYETVTGISNVYAFASNCTLHKRWSSYFNTRLKEYYTEDGYSEEFIQTMMRIFCNDFYNIVKIIDEFKLNTPQLQNDFFKRKNIDTLLDFLIQHFYDKDTKILYDLHYYRYRKESQEKDNKTKCIQSAVYLAETKKNDYKSDEAKIFLKLLRLNKSSYSRNNFKNNIYYEIYTLVDKIERGKYRFKPTNPIFNKALLAKFLELITNASYLINFNRLKIFINFIIKNETLFANKDTFISFLFRLANRDCDGAGDSYRKKAEEIIDKYEWPRKDKVKFALNNGAYYERQHNYERAYIFYEKALKHVNQIDSYVLASLYYHLGLCDMYRRKKKSAKLLFNKCLELVPEHVKAREYLVKL